MASGFYLLDTLGDANDRDLCILRNFVEGLEGKSHYVQFGTPLTPFHPPDARIHMDERSQGIKLSSLVGTIGGTLIVHREFKELIEKHCKGADIEYLPFTLYDHRKRVHSRDYFIINPLGTFDCLDYEACGIKWGKNNPDILISIRERVLDRKKMEKAPQLFRIGKDSTSYVVGVELARDMYDHDLTNIVWEELDFSEKKTPGKKK